MSEREMEDYERIGMIDSMQCARDAPTEYVPPPHKTKWRIFRAIGMLPIESNDKAVLSLIVDHANPITGRADPGQLRIARLLGLTVRTVKRCIRRLRKTPYLSRTLRGLSTTAYQVHWAAILYHDRTYDAAKRCQTCPLDGDSAVPLVVSEPSPKNEKGKRKEKTKHEMAPSNEGASLNASQNGFQVGANGDASTTLDPSAEPIGPGGLQGDASGGNEKRPNPLVGPLSLDNLSRKFWGKRRDTALDALKSEKDPERRKGLEAVVGRANDHLGGMSQ
jgi:hypothetical protein